MTHLTDAAAIDLAQAQGDEQVAGHAASCQRCHRLVARFRLLLDGLQLAAAPQPEVPATLLHWARTCTRAMVPVPPRPSLLRLLARGAQPVAAVRGSAVPGTAALFGDGRFQVDLQIEPTPAGRHRLRGQVVPVADCQERRWTIRVVGEDGSSHQASSNHDGEFTIEQLTGWSGLLMVADSGDERLIIPRLEGTAEP